MNISYINEKIQYFLKKDLENVKFVCYNNLQDFKNRRMIRYELKTENTLFLCGIKRERESARRKPFAFILNFETASRVKAGKEVKCNEKTFEETIFFYACACGTCAVGGERGNGFRRNERRKSGRIAKFGY